MAEDVDQALAEMDRLHPGGQIDYRRLDPGQFPTFVRTELGPERHFSQEALEALWRITGTLHSNDRDLRSSIRKKQLNSQVMRVFADLHAEGEFDRDRGMAIRALRERVVSAVKAMAVPITHYFPAWTHNLGDRDGFSVGPVRFHSREAWVRAQGSGELGLVGRYARIGGGEWREQVLKRLSEPAAPTREADDHWFDWVKDGLKDCPAVLEVGVSGSEAGHSRERAHIAVRAALDSVALLFQGRDAHRAFVLYEQARVPARRPILQATDGQLGIPNSLNSGHEWFHHQVLTPDFMRGAQPLIDAAGLAIHGFLNPGTTRTPKLALRWISALGWFGDGCRESRDDVAVTKLVASLDVLCAAGKDKGIFEMLKNLLQATGEEIVTRAPPMTMKAAVTSIYKSGRSQLIHGGTVDPMLPWEFERSIAGWLGYCALRVSAQRLTSYEGPDDDKAFRMGLLPP